MAVDVETCIENAARLLEQAEGALDLSEGETQFRKADVLGSLANYWSDLGLLIHMNSDEEDVDV